MALAASSTQLGCGRDIDQVWDHLDSAPDAHELSCPSCRAARADLAGLASATRALRDADAADPDLEPGPGVLDRVLAVARAEVRRGRRLPLDPPTTEQTRPGTVSEQAVTAVVRRTGDRTGQVQGQVQIRRCALTLDVTGTGPGVLSGRGAADSGAAAVAVSLRVSVVYDLSIADACHALRGAVIAAVQQEVGIHVSSVDITVEDLHDA